MNLKSFIVFAALAMSSVGLAAGKQIVVTVNGMVCAFCAQGITKKFGEESAVEKVEVKLEAKTVTVDLKKDADITDARINEILTSSGFNVEKIERK
jgi:copper chaperone CopZ